MTHGSLFSGIGGFDLAAEWMGWENLFHCEWNPFGQKVLKHYWPNAESFNDITKTNFTKYANKIDVLTGGFPCQPFSSAGKRLGKEDARHLWPEMLRAIREIKPKWVVGENVRGLTNWNGGMVFDEVQSDLEAIGYEVLPFLLPACAVNAPHRRDRIWFVAHGTGNRRDRKGTQFENKNRKQESGEFWKLAGRFERLGFSGITSDANSEQRRERRLRPRGNEPGTIFGDACTQLDWRTWENFPTQSPVRNGNDGIPSGLDGITFPKWRNESIKAGGNAIVPQVALQIFKTIQQYEKVNTNNF